MKKENELVCVSYSNGFVYANLYNIVGKYFHTVSFTGYNKKQIFYKLRHDYSCIVRRGQ